MDKGTKERASSVGSRDLQMIAHDLRSSFSNAVNLVHLLTEEVQDQRPIIKSTLSQLSQQCFDVLKLFEDMLGTSNGASPVASDTMPKPIKLIKIVGDVIKILNPNPNVKILIATPLPTLHVHELTLFRVFLNIINNSLKYCDKPHTVIEIKAISTANFHQILVEDNGPGLANEKIKEYFHDSVAPTRLNPSREGHGYGLTIIREQMKNAGGSVRVSSIPGKGTTFNLSFPR